jgi:hypothetical protein
LCGAMLARGQSRCDFDNQYQLTTIAHDLQQYLEARLGHIL